MKNSCFSVGISDLIANDETNNKISQAITQKINDVKNLINKLKSKNIGVLITDHNVRETLSRVDRAYILFDGSVIMSGNPSEIKIDHRVRDVYLGNNF